MKLMPKRWVSDAEDAYELGSPKAYDAWTHYRDLPAYQRTIRAAHREHMVECEDSDADDTSGYGTWVQWASRYEWTMRAREIDEEIASYRLGERVAAQQRIDEQELELGDAAIAKAIQRIETMHPDDIPTAMLDRFVRGFSDLRRRAVQTEDSEWNAEKHELRVDAKASLIEKLTEMAGRIGNTD